MVWLFTDNLKNKRVVVNEGELICMSYDRELYTSMYYYDNDMIKHLKSVNGSVGGFDGNVYGNYFIVDFDSTAGPEVVAEALMPMLKKLKHLGIPYYLFLSGKKGFHFYIHKKYVLYFFFFFKQKTAYEIYQCDWSSDVCSSDLCIGMLLHQLAATLTGIALNDLNRASLEVIIGKYHQRDLMYDLIIIINDNDFPWFVC